MKSLQLLWQVALKELGAWCDICTIRDRKTASDRFEDEGLSFFTITLPSFGKDFQKSLDLGMVTHDHFAGFSRHGGLPRFLGGFLELIFDRRSGQLLDEPSIDAIFAVRQLTLMLGKVNLRCAPHREKAAIDGYIECEREIRKSDLERTEVDNFQFSRIALIAFAPLFDSVERRVGLGDLRGRHSNGSTADGLRGNAKYHRMQWTDRLEEVLPAINHLVTRQSKYDLLEGVDFSEPGQEPPAKVVLVPKTLKTPRVIAMEPTHMQFVQQALLELFLSEFYRDNLLCSLIGFDDQTPNQRLAKKGSENGSLATLDLSEASDRVSNQHVRLLLAQHPLFAEVVDACRSRKADVPGHGVQRLAKFASMGSALTFPMEAMIFLVIVLMGVERTLNRPLTRKDIYRLRGKVRIFGDDIVVPKEYVTAVISTLETFGYRVNAGKSFWTGKFRESCGKDYYDGQDVSVVKVTEVLPTSRKHTEEILSSVATRNQFYKIGMWRTSQWMDDLLQGVLKHYPVVGEDSPLIGRHSAAFSPENAVWCYKLQRPLVRGYRSVAVLPKSPLEGEAALMKFFLKRGEDPLDDGHLERAGRAKSAYLKLGWGPSA